MYIRLTTAIVKNGMIVLVKIKTWTPLGHLNFSVAANAAWSDGHSPP